MYLQLIPISNWLIFCRLVHPLLKKVELDASPLSKFHMFQGPERQISYLHLSFMSSSFWFPNETWSYMCCLWKKHDLYLIITIKMIHILYFKVVTCYFLIYINCLSLCSIQLHLSYWDMTRNFYNRRHSRFLVFFYFAQNSKIREYIKLVLSVCHLSQ